MLDSNTREKEKFLQKATTSALYFVFVCSKSFILFFFLCVTKENKQNCSLNVSLSTLQSNFINCKIKSSIMTFIERKKCSMELESSNMHRTIHNGLRIDWRIAIVYSSIWIPYFLFYFRSKVRITLFVGIIYCRNNGRMRTHHTHTHKHPTYEKNRTVCPFNWTKHKLKKKKKLSKYSKFAHSTKYIQLVSVAEGFRALSEHLVKCEIN